MELKSTKHFPKLLAIDASDNGCSVAVQYFSPNLGVLVVDSLLLMETVSQSSNLLTTIKTILASNSLCLQDLDALVLSVGPGRFTGLRIAASCVQGLAYGLNKPVITLDSLQLQAQQYAANNELPVDNIIWVCQKAYAGHYYQAKFQLDSNCLIWINPKDNECVKSQAEIITELNTSPLSGCNFVGSGWLDLANAAGHIVFDETQLLQPIDIKYGFWQANQEFFADNFKEATEIELVYAVNPYNIPIKNN